jgi:hypothetical protein
MVQIAEKMGSSYGLATAASEAFLDVFADGFVFRVRLMTDRDTVWGRSAPLCSSAAAMPVAVDLRAFPVQS